MDDTGPKSAFSLIVTAIISTSQAVAQTVELTDYTGPRRLIDLLRPSEGGSRILVQAGLPDGSLGLFMIDTGADISVLTQGVSDQLGLNVDKNWGVVEGLSGNIHAPRRHSVHPSRRRRCRGGRSRGGPRWGARPSGRHALRRDPRQQRLVKVYA